MGEDLERRTGRTKKRTTLHTNRTVENQSRWTRAVRTSLREHEKHTRAPALRVLQELRRLAVLDAEIDRQQATFPRPALPPPPPKPTPLVLREGLHFTGKTCLHHHRRRLEPQDGEYGFPAPGEVPKPRRERENRSHQQLYGLFSSRLWPPAVDRRCLRQYFSGARPSCRCGHSWSRLRQSERF